MHSLTLRTVSLLLALLLCHCGAPQPPRCVKVPAASRQPAATLVASAREQWAILGTPSRSTEWSAAQLRYNAAVAKLFDQLSCGPGGWESRAAAMGSRIAPPDARQLDLAHVDALFPASRVNVRSLQIHQTTAGVGVPLVGWKETTPVGVARPAYQLPNGLPYIVTASLAFNGSAPPVWQFTKRWLHNDLPVAGTRHPLAADWSAPNAFFWQMCDLDNLKIQNVIRPDRYMEETGIYFLQPYDPKKIPVVFVHGLVSSPDAFKNMINALAPEPWFRENYQIWLYNYPTGNPWLFSSTQFRELMHKACADARARGDDHNLNRMVVVGHSMGGLIARSSVTDPKTALYDAYFKKPLDQIKVSAAARDLIRETTLYQPLSEPKRVVFLAVPHRGSPVANLRISLWLSRLIRLPKTLTVELLDKTLTTMGDILEGDTENYALPTSINSLSPNCQANLGLDKLALPAGIHFHSVVGDRGRGDSPLSSDGIVPYASSHVRPVASELIVASNHGVPNNPAAAAELKRILQLHLTDRR